MAVAQNSDTGDLVITGSKANLAPGGKPSLAARIVSATVGTSEGPTSVGRVQWMGETSDDARDLLDPDTATDRSDRTEAREWLQDFLGQGRMKSGDVKRAATAAGFSERTLQRARSNLKVRITSEGYPRITYWSLPAHPDSGATPEDSGAKGGRARGGAHLAQQQQLLLTCINRWHHRVAQQAQLMARPRMVNTTVMTLAQPLYLHLCQLIQSCHDHTRAQTRMRSRARARPTLARLTAAATSGRWHT